MIYLTSSNIFTLIEFTGFATWVRIIKIIKNNLLLISLSGASVTWIEHSLTPQFVVMLRQIIWLICFYYQIKKHFKTLECWKNVYKLIMFWQRLFRKQNKEIVKEILWTFFLDVVSQLLWHISGLFNTNCQMSIYVRMAEEVHRSQSIAI